MSAIAAKTGLTGDVALLDGDWLERMRGVRLNPAPLRALAGMQVYAVLSQKPFVIDLHDALQLH